MSFPVSPTNGQIAVVNNVAYEYATANTSWTRVLSIANVIQANVISANVLNVVQAFSITGNIATANYFIGNGAFLTGIAAGYSNTDVANYLPTYTGNLVSLTGPVTTTSNVTGGNILFGTGVVSGTGTVYAATVSTTGNVNSGYISTGEASVGNLFSGGYVSATGNITGNYILGNGALLTGVITSVSNINNGTSNVTVVSSGGNVTVGVGGTGNVAVFSTDAVTVKGNVLPSANITYDLGTSTQRWKDLWLSNSTIYLGNAQISANATAVTITNPAGGTTVLQGETPSITGAVVSASGNVTGGNILTAGLISATGNATGGNLLTGGLVSATANITGGNILTGGLISATSNITGGNLITANRTQSSNIVVTGGITAPAWGTTGIGIRTVASTYVDSTTANFGTAGTNHVHVLSIPTLSAANTAVTILTAATLYIAGAPTGGANGTVITRPYALLVNSGNVGVTANVDAGNLRTGGLISAAGAITGAAITGSSLSVTGNVTANNFVGNLTGIANTANYIYVNESVDDSVAYNLAYISPSGGGGTYKQIFVDNGQLTFNPGTNTLDVTQGNITTVNATTLSATGNVIGGNITTAGLISATGNATGGNLITAGLATVTGNIQGGNVRTAGLISATGNIQGGNLRTAGLISATGNITGGNLSGTNITGTLATAAQTNITSVGTLGALTVTANTTSGNLLTGGLINATGNITGGNVNTNQVVGTGLTLVSTGDLSLSATGNINVNNEYINNVPTPVADGDAVNKLYVDNFVTGLNVHDAVTAATPTTLATITSGAITYYNGPGANGVAATLTTTGTFDLIDTVNVQTAGTRILVLNEANAVTNCVYVWSNATAITRASDYNSVPEVEAGDFMFVTSGNVYGNTGWIQTSTVSNIGYAGNNITFTQFSGSGTYNAGTGLTLTGTTFSVNASQTQVTSVGTLGSLTVTANTTSGNLLTGGLINATSNITGGNLLTAGLISATGNITGGNLSGTNIVGTLTTAAQTNITSVGTLGALTVTANTTSGNLLTGGLISATGDITGGNLSGTNIAGTLTTATQTNITSVGTLGSLTVTANTTSGNLLTGGLISATGNITGGNVIADGVRVYKWTTVANTAPSGAVPGDNWYDSYADKLYLYVNDGTGNQWVDQSFPTTFASLTVSGNTSSGNLLTVGLVSATGNITGDYIFGNGSQLTGVITSVSNINSGTSNVTVVSSGGNISVGVGGTANVAVFATTGEYVTGLISASGNITGDNLITGGLVSATANITGGNIITAGLITASGNIASGNFVGTLNGSGANVTSISATNISSGTLAQARLANAAVTLGSTALTLGSTVTTVAGLTSVTSTTFVGALTGAATSATTAATVTTAAQPNITSVGTLTGLTINAATTAITNGAANGVGNIGTSANSFNTIFAKATSAQYADLAEMYVSDADYLPGTVLEFGGSHEVTISNTAASALIAGVVSTNPAHLMNSTAQGKHLAAIALVGRVPTLVVGPVTKGAMMVSAGNGHAQASATPAMGTVIGKAVEDFTGAAGTIEIAVGRL